jgi:hypothetical protein
MRDTLDFLEYLCICDNWKACLPNENVRKFFLNEFIYFVQKYLIFNRTFRLSEALAVSNRILEACLVFYLKSFDEDNPKLAESAASIFDLKRPYFKINDQADSNYSLMVIIINIYFYYFFSDIFTINIVLLL